MPAAEIRIGRVYDPPAADDGERVLIDRLWPRGLRRDDLAAAWVRDVAPSHELRRWFGHEEELFEEFERRYRDELGRGAAGAALVDLRDRARRGRLTLLTATRTPERSHAAVLRRVLLDEEAVPGG